MITVGIRAEGDLDEEQLTRALALERLQVVYRHLPLAFRVERNLMHLELLNY